MSDIDQRTTTTSGCAVNSEPRLHDIVDDPITRRLMASDGVERDHLLALVSEARAKLSRNPR